MSDPIQARMRRERGAAAVEFAIVLPVLLLVVLGIIDFGRAMFAQISLDSASIEGARASALGRSTTDVTRITQESAPRAAQFAGANAASITVVSTPCPKPANGALTTVTASLPFTWITPINLLPAASGTVLTATSRLQCAG